MTKLAQVVQVEVVCFRVLLLMVVGHGTTEMVITVRVELVAVLEMQEVPEVLQTMAAIEVTVAAAEEAGVQLVVHQLVVQVVQVEQP